MKEVRRVPRWQTITVYPDIVPNRRVVLPYTMSLGERRISASLATFEFLLRRAERS